MLEIWIVMWWSRSSLIRSAVRGSKSGRRIPSVACAVHSGRFQTGKGWRGREMNIFGGNCWRRQWARRGFGLLPPLQLDSIARRVATPPVLVPLFSSFSSVVLLLLLLLSLVATHGKLLVQWKLYSHRSRRFDPCVPRRGDAS